MDFSVDDTTAELTALVRDMGERLVTDDSLRELDARFGPGTESGGTDRGTARFHARYWEELVRAGVPAALAPESLGGAGLGVVGEALVLRELGRVLAPVPLSPAIRATVLLEAAGLSARAGAVAEGREIAAGLAEMIKHGAIADPLYLGELERDMARLAAVLTPYWRWNQVRLFGEPEPDDGGLTAPQVHALLRALLDRVRDVTGHPRPRGRQLTA